MLSELFALTIPVVDFEIPLEVLIFGAISGTSYALFAVGLTLTYQTSRVLNLAQGAMGAIPHLLVAKLVLDNSWGYWPALLTALVVAFGSGALLEVGVIRRLNKAPRLVVLVATIAASQIFLIPITLMVDLGNTNMALGQYPVPFEASMTIGGVNFSSGQLMVVFAGPLIVGALTFFLKKTSVGMAARGMAENNEAAELSGIPVRRISMIVWAIAGLLTGIAAILAGPTGPILTGALGGGGAGFTGNGDLLIIGLGAAMVGGLSSLPQVFAAGVGLGIVESLVQWNFTSGGNVELVLIVIILAALLLRKDLGQLTRGGEESAWSLSGSVRELPERVRNHPKVRIAHSLLIAGVVTVAVVVPLMSDAPRLILYSAILCYVMVALSLIVLTGWAGQVSLGHFTFVAIGAYTGGRMEQLGYPVFTSLAVALGAAALAAVLVGLPALRLRGLFLAVTTLAFAVVAQQWLSRQTWFRNTSGGTTSERLSRREFAGFNFRNEQTYYFLMLLLVLGMVLLLSQLRKTGFYRNLAAVRDNEPMAAALGVAPASTKLLAFVVSGCLAAFAGYFYGMLLVNFGTGGLFSITLSQLVITMVILGGSTSVTGAVLGALYIRGLPYFIDSAWMLLATSGFGLLIVLMFIPGGLASLAFQVRDRVVDWLVGDDLATSDLDGPARVPALRLEPRIRERAPDAPPPLQAIDLSKSYGGVQAVTSMSMVAHHGEIVGLIGPNGAGKTTTFDLLSGLVEPDTGQVIFHGQDITHRRPEQRAILGMGRSFQQASLFKELTIIETFKVALEREEPTEFLPSMLGLPPSNAVERYRDLRAAELVELLGLGDYAEKKAGELSTGTRRVAELGCTIALGASVILLDEPTGGIAQREVEAFTPVLRQVRDHLDATMIVVAHDIPMMVSLVDRIYVMASGAVIAEGPPSLLQTDAAVIAAYLGTTDEDELGIGAPATRPPMLSGAGNGNGRHPAPRRRGAPLVARSGPADQEVPQ